MSFQIKSLRRNIVPLYSKFININNKFATKVPKKRFRILGLQQIAIGGLDKEVLSNFWVDILGIKKIGSYESVEENVTEDILEINSGKSMFDLKYGKRMIEIDLMQPIDADRSPKVHTPALNHIGLWVDNLAFAVTDLTEQGIIFTPGGIRKGAAGYDVSFIHPHSATGVLVELIQHPEFLAKADILIAKDALKPKKVKKIKIVKEKKIKIVKEKKN